MAIGLFFTIPLPLKLGLLTMIWVADAVYSASMQWVHQRLARNEEQIKRKVQSAATAVKLLDHHIRVLREGIVSIQTPGSQ